MVIILGIGLAIVLPRLFALDRFLTADEKRWQANVNGFVTALAHGEFGHLLQQPHPGITTQWFGAPTIYSPSWATRKLPLVISQSILVAIIGYIFARLWGRNAGILLTVLLALNPLLIAHTRVYAMDSLLALFLLAAIGLLLLGLEHNDKKYLFASGVAGALAVLSKLPGVLMIPFALILLAGKHISHKDSWRATGTSLLVWAAGFIIATIIVFPSLAIRPIPVLQNIVGFFSSGDYQELHQEQKLFYLDTLIFSSTPLHLLALLTVPFGWYLVRSHPRVKKTQVASLLLFAGLFIVQMSLGAKKGDRYILPIFLIFDAITVAATMWLVSLPKPKLRTTLLAIIVVLITWQAALITRLHPYTLAYVNPITKPWFGERRLGWGEGLDLAAEYLNQKPNARQLKVASYFPVEYSYRFVGEAVPIHQYEEESIDYIVAYRAMFERGPEAWETDVLEHLKQRTPEKIISINGLPYVWIYRI